VDGTPTKVLAAHPYLLNLNCYRVIFSDGSEVICDEEHLWYTETKTDRTHHIRTPEGRIHTPRGGSVKTTKQIKDTLISRGEVNHAVPACDPVEFPVKNLLVDPYILGLWLGDGHSYHPNFTTMD